MSKPRTRAIQLALVAFTAILIVLILPLIGNIHDIEFLPGRDLELPTMTFGGGGGAGNLHLDAGDAVHANPALRRCSSTRNSAHHQS